MIQLRHTPITRWFFDKFRRRRKPTFDEMGIAPAPTEPSQYETDHIGPGSDEPGSAEWIESEPAPAQSPHTEPARPEKDFSTHTPEGERVTGYVERVLDAMRQRDRTRRWLFVKFILAWLVAYSLVTGELPWFMVKFWNWATAMLVQGGWISSTS